jgi:hypothetical protein
MRSLKKHCKKETFLKKLRVQKVVEERKFVKEKSRREQLEEM